MTDKEKIMDILLEFYEEYQGNIPNRPMIPSIYANKIIDSLQEEPVSEELGEAIDTYLATYFGDKKEMQNWPFLKKMAIYFANWQKNRVQ